MSQDSKCPYSSKPEPVSSSALTYGNYLKIPELLKLQVPQSDPSHPDELLFIVIHQSYELWFKLLIQEVETSIALMEEGKALPAQHALSRISKILKLLVSKIHLLETMRPIDFLEFRDRLMPASGFQSLQFREIEFLFGIKDPSFLTYFKEHPEVKAALEARLNGSNLKSAYYHLLSKQGFKIPKDAALREEEGDEKATREIMAALKEIYQDPDSHLPLYLLSELLVTLDESLHFWRFHHVVVVERVIGHKKGTGGSAGVEYLRSTVMKRAFPLLWEVRTELKKR